MCGITSYAKFLYKRGTLWFAYRMYLWCVESQVLFLNFLFQTRCDLLTECIFDVWNHKIDKKISLLCVVVICLQNVSLMCGITSNQINITNWIWLWFAYRMYLWCVESQDNHIITKQKPGCDLLTECIFDVWNHKRCYIGMPTFFVVICLQNVSLMCGITRLWGEYSVWFRLWFAYRMYLWCVESQERDRTKSLTPCCDLLTECIFDVWNHKCIRMEYYLLLVVICLQNVSLMCGITRNGPSIRKHNQLWFAYRMYLWCVESQAVY